MNLAPHPDAIAPIAILSAKWPFPRAEMTEPGLIVCRLAEDIADLFDSDGDELSIDALVSLGWPRDIVAQYFDAANSHAAPIIATGLRRRLRVARAARNARPIPLDPPRESAPEYPAPREPAPARLSGPRPDPWRAFACGMAGGGLGGAAIAFSVLRLLEALQ